MSNDMPVNKWQQVGHEAQIFWPKIDEQDLDAIAGTAAGLAGVLQHKYGYTKEHAESQSIRWLSKHGDEPEAE